MRPLSLDHLTIIEATPLELIQAAAAGGFEKVGLRIVRPMAAADVVDVIGQPQLQRDLKALMASTGVSIGLVEAIWLSADTDPSALEPALATGAELGARQVLVAGNDPDEARSCANLSRLALDAKSYGLEIAFEFMPFTKVRSLEDAVRIMRQVAQPNLRLLVDALHVSRSGQDLSTLGKLDSSIVSYVHLCDAPAALPPPDGLRDEARLGRLYPGDGELDLDAFLDAMPDDAPVGLEAPCRAYAHLPPIERGRMAGRITRAWLQRHDERR
ncbi:MAG: TIM barrel protein [Pseudolabrys sp.]|nr:TIM barrel protein [Pseudolabrys sp.]